MFNLCSSTKSKLNMLQPAALASSRIFMCICNDYLLCRNLLLCGISRIFQRLWIQVSSPKWHIHNNYLVSPFISKHNINPGSIFLHLVFLKKWVLYYQTNSFHSSFSNSHYYIFYTQAQWWSILTLLLWWLEAEVILSISMKKYCL